MLKNLDGENPIDEYAIVGTMFFSNKKVYNKSLTKLL